VVGIWFDELDGDPWLSVLTATSDDELEERLYEAFDELAQAAGNPTLGRLDIHAANEPHPTPRGTEILPAPDGTQLLLTDTAPSQA
jgi:hypothetical protein